MKASNLLEQEDDWQVLLSFLPSGWDAMAKELGALQRYRKFLGAENLLRMLLIHLIDGCSLRETVVRAKYGQLASISDVALLKRLNASGEWFRWMAEELMKTWVEKQPQIIFGEDLCVRIIDVTTVQEPASTNATWRIHYSIRLPSLKCDEVHVTSSKEGETFKRFRVRPQQLLIGDRGLAHRSGVRHVIENGGEVLVRINLTNLPLEDRNGTPFSLLSHLRTLGKTELGDWDAWVPYKGSFLKGRVCALKKSNQAAERSKLRSLQENSRKGHIVQPETLEAAEYTFVFTTLDRRVSPVKVLEIYRGRWQIELAFKRLKSIIGIGHLRKADIDGAKAWIQGKLLVSFLIEALIAAGERFFPWGYPLVTKSSVSLEGNLDDASFSQ